MGTCDARCVYLRHHTGEKVQQVRLYSGLIYLQISNFDVPLGRLRAPGTSLDVNIIHVFGIRINYKMVTIFTSILIYDLSCRALSSFE